MSTVSVIIDEYVFNVYHSDFTADLMPESNKYSRTLVQIDMLDGNIDECFFRGRFTAANEWIDIIRRARMDHIAGCELCNAHGCK